MVVVAEWLRVFEMSGQLGEDTDPVGVTNKDTSLRLEVQQIQPGTL